MSWAKRLETLPLRIHTPDMSIKDVFDGKPEEYLREDNFVATRIFIPLSGIMYAFSFDGEAEEIESLVREITEELGIPVLTAGSNSNRQMRFWKAASQEMPETEIHRVVGKSTIDAICQQNGLNKQGRKCVDIWLTISAAPDIDDETKTDTIACAFIDLSPRDFERIIYAAAQIKEVYDTQCSRNR